MVINKKTNTVIIVPDIILRSYKYRQKTTMWLSSDK